MDTNSLERLETKIHDVLDSITEIESIARVPRIGLAESKAVDAVYKHIRAGLSAVYDIPIDED